MYPRTIRYVKDDQRPPLIVHAFKPDMLTEADFTGVLSVKIWMRDLDTLADKISGAVATLVSPNPGIVSYAWSATDLNALGRYAVWFRVYYGAIDTVPATIIGPELWVVADAVALTT